MYEETSDMETSSQFSTRAVDFTHRHGKKCEYAPNKIYSQNGI